MNYEIKAKMPHRYKRSEQELDNWIIWQALEWFLPILASCKDNSECQKENYDRAIFLSHHFREGVMNERDKSDNEKI